MYERQMTRDYHLQKDIEQKSSDQIKWLIDFMLEPDAKKRPTILEVLAHPWIPIIHQEAVMLANQ